jgi:hypothetical protein
MERLTAKVVLGPSIDERIFHKLHMWRPILLHNRLLSTNKNLAEGL